MMQEHSDGGYQPSAVIFMIFGGLVLLGLLTMLSVDGAMIYSRSQLSVPVQPYAFLLLLIFIVPFAINALWVMAGLTVLYFLMFAYVIYLGHGKKSRRMLENPVSFIGMSIPFLYVVSVAILLLENVFGVQVGNPISTSSQIDYLDLIYAPFVEEIGFRIIPLGILVLAEALFVINAGRFSEKPGEFGMGSLLIGSFIFPGKLRRRLGIRMGRAEWAGIILTAALFGYAHYFFGEWDIGKISQAAFVGVLFAIGFLEFGPFVDILMHWFFNGYFTFVEYISGFAPVALVDVNLVWLFLAGIASLVYFFRWLISRGKPSGEHDPLT
ncbi:MAG: hypothetical protein M1267_01235 [Candidatus Thermoplasmatota archaeon]|nr:hypothetical protein [Candidatus Thermoplasmatota archaeon]